MTFFLSFLRCVKRDAQECGERAETRTHHTHTHTVEQRVQFSILLRLLCITLDPSLDRIDLFSYYQIHSESMGAAFDVELETTTMPFVFVCRSPIAFPNKENINSNNNNKKKIDSTHTHTHTKESTWMFSMGFK